MSFQAYLDTIKAKTGKTSEDFKTLAEQKGLLREGVKTGQIVAWLKEGFGLGHGHAMAIVLALKSGVPLGKAQIPPMPSACVATPPSGASLMMRRETSRRHDT